MNMKLKPWYFKLPVGMVVTASMALLVVRVARVADPVTPPAAKAASRQAAGVPPEIFNSNGRKRTFNETITYIQMHVQDVAVAREEIAKLITQAQIREVKQSVPTRVYVVTNGEQFVFFVRFVATVGKVKHIEPVDRFPADFPPSAPHVPTSPLPPQPSETQLFIPEEKENPIWRSVIVDLVPAESAATVP